jgi:hypothetical protein
VSKPLAKATFQRVFKKESSVFATWVHDTPQLIQTCLQHDFRYWKLDRIVKSEDEQMQIKNLVKQYFLEIKEVFIGCLAESEEYPSIPEFDYI